ncbi:hypothetical protein MFIFM68171_02716 [Madurella fahalii]|uniref:Protein kinase domain-containing protein n=1 Tax=Madurella fahalii TaxID=1157608 RepID=A0ABQ0G446_9PEZI
MAIGGIAHELPDHMYIPEIDVEDFEDYIVGGYHPTIIGDIGNRQGLPDVWTLGVRLYEILGERRFRETFSWVHDDILADMISTPEAPPARWEMGALEEILSGMLAFEPDKRLMAEQLVRCEYVVKWALPA